MGQTAVFYRNSQLLILLCLVSGICSGVRSGCFGMANMILEMVHSCCNEIPQPGTLGYLDAVLCYCCHVWQNNLMSAGASFNVLQLKRLRETLFAALIFQQFQKKVAKFTQEYSASANEAAQGTFSLIRTVRVYGTEEEELGRYKQWLDKLVYIGIRESVAYGSWYLSFNTLYRSTQVFAVLLGGMLILTGHVSAEQLMKYVLYCEWLIYAAWRLEDHLSSLLQAIGASEKVFQLMVLMPSDQFLSKGMKLQRLVGKIEFVNVSFYYPSRSMVPVLEHANISVQTNEMVAIVGLSGSGKSTLVNLLLRLYEPTSGEEKLDIRWLRDRIGFVGQEPHLFHMDVKSNISYGCSRDIKQQDVEWAAKQANAHEFISSLPNGYETIVDDGLLSGGQKQRIAIARAIVRDPAILILDEATSALDAENEYYIARLLHAFRNDCRVKRTVIVIAHGLSTIKAADKIMVMDGGRVVECMHHMKFWALPHSNRENFKQCKLGNHVDLLCKGGLYARFVRTKTDDLA
ncbi:unnamed protein product [Camellia sinensis]